MRCLLLVVTLWIGTADRAADRATLLATDRALATAAETGGLRALIPALAESAAYLHPGAPLLFGATNIRSFLETTPASALTWVPTFADVSSDGTLGYTYGWTRAPGERGKYLACWRKISGGWRIAAYARTNPVAVPDSVPLPLPHKPPAEQTRPGRAEPAELLQADSAFSALSVAQGGKVAFSAFASEDAVSFGGGAQLTEGRAAIAAGFDDFPAGAVLEWWPRAAQIARSGDLGCTVGEARITSLHHYSKYLTIWKRQDDGSWKFVADGGNARPAPTDVSGTPPPED
jgi:ketosteroid isomerase-like protein